MKARFVYPLLYLPLSLMAAGLAAMMFAVCAAGVLWIFIYGDNEWPAPAERILVVLSAVIFAAIVAVLFVALYKFGKKQELQGGLSRKHALIAVAATLLLPLLILARQRSMAPLAAITHTQSAAVGDG